MEELQTCKQQALKTRIPWSNAFKAEGKILLIQNSISSHLPIKWEDRIKRFSDTHISKSLPPMDLFPENCCKTCSIKWRKESMKKYVGQMKQKIQPGEGQRESVRLWRRSPQWLLRTKHRRFCQKIWGHVLWRAHIHNHPYLQSDHTGTGKAHACTLKRKWWDSNEGCF